MALAIYFLGFLKKRYSLKQFIDYESATYSADLSALHAAVLSHSLPLTPTCSLVLCLPFPSVCLCVCLIRRHPSFVCQMALGKMLLQPLPAMRWTLGQTLHQLNCIFCLPHCCCLCSSLCVCCLSVSMSVCVCCCFN